jgi:hypothetical protein
VSQPEILRWDQAYNRNGDRKLQRTVVNAIRTYMNNHTLTGWVKAETLVRDTGIKERTVREQIAANVAAGWLEVVESGNSSGRANTYRLTYPNHAPERRVEGEPCAAAQGNHAPQRTPTSPRTSPQEKFSIGTTPEENHALQRMVPDPWGSGGSNLPATGIATESNHALQRRVPDGAPERTVPDSPEGRLLSAIRSKGSVGAKSDLASLMGVGRSEVNVIIPRMLAAGLIIHDTDREHPALVLA